MIDLVESGGVKYLMTFVPHSFWSKSVRILDGRRPMSEQNCFMAGSKSFLREVKG